MADDIIAGFIADLRESHPEITNREWLQMEIRWRKQWGGERHYVVKALPLGKAFSLSESLAAGQSISEAARTLGIHRRTCHRLLRFGWVGDY